MGLIPGGGTARMLCYSARKKKKKARQAGKQEDDVVTCEGLWEIWLLLYQASLCDLQQVAPAQSFPTV